jgi:hypothetical protein
MLYDSTLDRVLFYFKDPITNRLWIVQQFAKTRSKGPVYLREGAPIALMVTDSAPY